MKEHCKICGKEFRIRGGVFATHIKKVHGITSYEDYYYMFNKEDLCVICNTRRKKFLGRKQQETCNSKECGKKRISNGVKKYQTSLVELGLNNLQQESTKINKRLKMEEMCRNGELWRQSDEGRKSSSDHFTKMNKENNPMWKDENRKNMSLRKKGIPLSEPHKNSISKGLSKYLESLSDEEFEERMRNTYNRNCDIDEELIINKIMSRPSNDVLMNQFYKNFNLKCIEDDIK
jgi:hypothetical protein